MQVECLVSRALSPFSCEGAGSPGAGPRDYWMFTYIMLQNVGHSVSDVAYHNSVAHCAMRTYVGAVPIISADVSTLLQFKINSLWLPHFAGRFGLVGQPVIGKTKWWLQWSIVDSSRIATILIVTPAYAVVSSSTTQYNSPVVIDYADSVLRSW